MRRLCCLHCSCRCVDFFGRGQVAALLGVLLYAVIQFSWLMLRAGKARFDEISGQLAASVAIPFALLSLLRLAEMGRAYLLLPFVVAFASDAGAYFAGVYFGKHRAAGGIDPDRTYESIIGGLLAALVATAAYSVIMLIFYNSVSWLGIIVYGILGSAVGQFGNAVFSYIRRQYNIKNFGKWMPGHGGCARPGGQRHILRTIHSGFVADNPPVYMRGGLTWYR